MAVSTTQLRQFVTANYADNHTGEVSPKDLRDGIYLMADIMDAADINVVIDTVDAYIQYARLWATQDENVEVEAGYFSAFHHATKAAAGVPRFYIEVTASETLNFTDIKARLDPNTLVTIEACGGSSGGRRGSGNFEGCGGGGGGSGGQGTNSIAPDGDIPGGGGAAGRNMNSGAGARGEVRIWI